MAPKVIIQKFKRTIFRLFLIMPYTVPQEHPKISITRRKVFTFTVGDPACHMKTTENVMADARASSSSTKRPRCFVQSDFAFANSDLIDQLTV